MNLQEYTTFTEMSAGIVEKWFYQYVNPNEAIFV